LVGGAWSFLVGGWSAIESVRWHEVEEEPLFVDEVMEWEEVDRLEVADTESQYVFVCRENLGSTMVWALWTLFLCVLLLRNVRTRRRAD